MKGNVHHPDSDILLFDHDFICDSGAEVSVIPIELVQKHGLQVHPTGKRVEMANRTDANCQAVVELLLVKVGPKMCRLKFLVVGGVKIGILGLDAMGKLGVMLNTTDKVVTLTGSDPQDLGEEKVECQEIPSKCYHIRLIQSCDIKPFEERFIWGKFEDKNAHIKKDAYIEGTEHFQERTWLLTAPTKMSPDMIEKDKRIPICVLNVTDKPIRVFREQTAATIQELPVTHSVVQVATVTTTVGREYSVEYNPMSDFLLGEELSEEQKNKLETLINQNKTVFDYPGNQGYTTTIEHTILTGEAEPIMCRPRRNNLGLTQKINDAVDKHVKAGHLTPLNSPWAFPIVPVLKPDKTVRLCVDYRPLNKITQNDPFPTGNLQEVLDNLAGANYFSVIDLAQGYLQVPLAEKDRPKTAFRSPTGFWEWTRMPCGLKGSPATFSRLIHKVLGLIPPSRLALYMDDICIISKTFEEHLGNIQEVFDAINAHGLKIKAKKCLLAMKEVTFLGHKLNRYGVKPAEQKVQAITN